MLNNPFLTGIIAHFLQFTVFGAQNFFVLRNSFGKNIFIIPFICITCDAIMISTMMFGFIENISQNKLIINILKISGAAFLILYAIKSLIKAFEEREELVMSQEIAFKTSISMALSVSILNPGAWIDTFAISTIGLSFGINNLHKFFIGNVIGASIWFALLALFSKVIAKQIQKPKNRKFVDISTGLIMFYIAINLILH